MHFTSLAVAALAAVSSAVSIPAANMTDDISTMTTLTRIANEVTRVMVYPDNPKYNRQVTVKIINAIGKQGTEDLSTFNGGNTAAAYSAADQLNIAKGYATFVAVTNEFLAATVEKHLAVVDHGEAHSMGNAMKSTFAILDNWSTAILSAAPAQSAILKNQKSLFDQAYTMAVNLYLNGPNSMSS